MELNNYESIDLGFSTADAEIVSIKHFSKEMKLELEMIDWREEKLKITFDHVLAYSLQYIASTHWDYRTCIVNNSKWRNEQIANYTDDHSSEDLSHIKHYRLCFNATNEELNIVCTDIKEAAWNLF
jgi:hypothetical protein